MKKLSDCTLLIAEGTEASIDILVDALGDDYRLSVATDGASAIEAAGTGIPDIILLDSMMPGMSGYEVCRRLKKDKATADIPIIFMTAMTDAESRTKGFELGADDYIAKPFEMIEVKARVRTHLSLRLATLELTCRNEILEEKAFLRTRELSLTQQTTIEALASLAEYHDPMTGGHIKRTQNYVRALAENLRKRRKYSGVLTDEVIDQLYRSAPLHDIGKIGIRDEILLKPGRLTAEEFEEMKNHTVIGYNALRTASRRLGENSFLKYAMELARYHQEKWDGTGYPDGLSGENIPLSGRIMAVADVYDALISRRPYKPPFPHEKAVAIIKEESGKHFDPELVGAFLEISEEFRQIAMIYTFDEEDLPDESDYCAV